MMGVQLRGVGQVKEEGREDGGGGEKGEILTL